MSQAQVDGLKKKQRQQRKGPKKHVTTYGSVDQLLDDVEKMEKAGSTGSMDPSMQMKKRKRMMSGGEAAKRPKGVADATLLELSRGLAGVDEPTITKLKDLKTPEVLEIYAVDKIQLKDGPVLKLGCIYHDKGERVSRVFFAPLRFEEALAKGPIPAVAVYFGLTRPTHGAYDYHKLEVVNPENLVGEAGLDSSSTARRIADHFRGKNKDELMDYFRVRKLTEFDVDTYIAYDNVQTVFYENKKTGETTVSGIVRARVADKDGVRPERSMTIPERLIEEAKRNAPGIMVYKGMQRSKSTGRDYALVSFISSGKAEAVVAAANGKKRDVDVEVVDLTGTDDEADSPQSSEEVELVRVKTEPDTGA